MTWWVGSSLDVLLAEINASAPGRSKVSDGSIGDADHSSRTSDHNPCDCHDCVCARDFTHDPAGGFDSYVFADWLAERTRGPEDRVKYIISRGRIASGQGQDFPAGEWRPYTGSNPHDHHVHISVRHGPEHFDDGRPWSWGDPIPHPPELEPELYQGAPEMFVVIDSPVAGNARFQGIVIANQLIALDDTQYVHAVKNSTGVPTARLHESTPDQIIANLVKATANYVEG